jgi:hypothetical protein
MNLYTANQYIQGMSEEEKKKSSFDDKLFGDDKYKESNKLNLSKGEAIGLGKGILSSFAQGLNRQKQMNEQKEMMANRKANDYMPAMSKTYAYNTFSENPYNNSYFDEGGEQEQVQYTDDSYSDYNDNEDNSNSYNDFDYDTSSYNQNNYADITGGYSPFDKNEDDELINALLSSMLEDDDDMNFFFGDDNSSSVSNYESGFNSSRFSSNPTLPASSSSLPIQPVIEHLESIGLKPSSVKSGDHNKRSKHYSGHALDLGLNTSFGGDHEKMREFIDYFNNELKPKFPNLRLLDERKKPANQRVWNGPHLHLELI